MDLRSELVNHLTSQADISSHEATSSIDTVLGSLRQHSPEAASLLAQVGGHNAPASSLNFTPSQPEQNMGLLSGLLGQQSNLGSQKSGLVTSLILSFLMSRLPQLGGMLGGFLGGQPQQPQMQQPQGRSNNPLDRNHDGSVGLDDLFASGSQPQPPQYQQPQHQQPQARSNNPLDRNQDGKVDLGDLFGGGNQEHDNANR